MRRDLDYVQDWMNNYGQFPQLETFRVIKGLVEVLYDLAGRLNCLEGKP